MKDLMARGLMTGLVGGIGCDLFYLMLDMGAPTVGGMALGLFAGIVGGVCLGLLMMLLLGLLKVMDRRFGWALAPRLERSEPGLLGFMVGLLATFPGAGLGGVGFGIGAWHILVMIYHSMPQAEGYAFAMSCLLGFFVLPAAILIGMSLGALVGATLGSGLVGFLRGCFSRDKPPGGQAD